MGWFKEKRAKKRTGAEHQLRRTCHLFRLVTLPGLSVNFPSRKPPMLRLRESGSWCSTVSSQRKTNIFRLLAGSQVSVRDVAAAYRTIPAHQTQWPGLVIGLGVVDSYARAINTHNNFCPTSAGDSVYFLKLGIETHSPRHSLITIDGCCESVSVRKKDLSGRRALRAVTHLLLAASNLEYLPKFHSIYSSPMDPSTSTDRIRVPHKVISKVNIYARYHPHGRITLHSQREYMWSSFIPMHSQTCPF